MKCAIWRGVTEDRLALKGLSAHEEQLRQPEAPTLGAGRRWRRVDDAMASFTRTCAAQSKRRLNPNELAALCSPAAARTVPDIRRGYAPWCCGTGLCHCSLAPSLTLSQFEKTGARVSAQARQLEMRAYRLPTLPASSSKSADMFWRRLSCSTASAVLPLQLAVSPHWPCSDFSFYSEWIWIGRVVLFTAT